MVPAPLNASVATVKVAGHSYPAVTERNCLTCTSPFRWEIEEQILLGRTYARIVAELPKDASLSARNLADHFRNGHIPLQEATVQALVDDHAEKRGEALQPTVEAAVEHVDFARRLLSRVSERVLDGEIEPNIRDGLRAAEFIAKYDTTEPVGADLFTQAFIVYFDTARQLMSDDQFIRFGKQLNDNELLSELQEEWHRRQQNAPSDGLRSGQ